MADGRASGRPAPSDSHLHSNPFADPGRDDDAWDHGEDDDDFMGKARNNAFLDDANTFQHVPGVGDAAAGAAGPSGGGGVRVPVDRIDMLSAVNGFHNGVEVGTPGQQAPRQLIMREEPFHEVQLPAKAAAEVEKVNRCLECGPRVWASLRMGSAKGTYANVGLLALCWALTYSVVTSSQTTTAIAANSIVNDKALSTLPVGMIFVGSAVFVIPVVLGKHLFGRRISFMVGCLMGIIGAAMCTGGMFSSSYGWLLVGSLFIGGSLAHAQFYRFAAAEVSTLQFRSHAISLVLAGGILAAIIGPQLSKWTRNWIGDTQFAGTYIGMIILFVLNLLPLFFVDFSPPPEQEPVELEEFFMKASTITTDGVVVKIKLTHYNSAAEASGPARPLQVILGQAECAVSIIVASLAYGAMLFIMTPLPVAMENRGYSFNEIALVIQLHMITMFLPALFTGYLMQLISTFGVTVLGNILFLIAIIIMIAGEHYGNFLCGMLFLGVAWNFMFIGATNRFVRQYRISETTKAQAANDMIVSSFSAFCSLISGAAAQDLGWTGVQWVSLGALAFSLFLSIGLQLLHRKKKGKQGLMDLDKAINKVKNALGLDGKQELVEVSGVGQLEIQGMAPRYVGDPQTQQPTLGAAPQQSSPIPPPV